MTIPARPIFIVQGPANHCVWRGVALGWQNCTPTSHAMGISKATLRAKNPSGCDIRIVTGDSVGGTTIPQCAEVCRVEYGLTVIVRVGDAAAAPGEVGDWLRSGRGVALQGNAGALVHTPYRSTGGPVNHCVYVNEGRGWKKDTNGHWVPTEVLWEDPAADGRPAAWGHASQGPTWVPWGVAKAFASALRPWGDNDPRTLGPGRMYVTVFPDTEPHAHLRFGGARTAPFPDRVVIHVPPRRRANVRSRVDRYQPGDIVARWVNRTPFIAYQRTHGVRPPGSASDVWYGDHDGRLWVHESNLASIGGAS